MHVYAVENRPQRVKVYLMKQWGDIADAGFETIKFDNIILILNFPMSIFWWHYISVDLELDMIIALRFNQGKVFLCINIQFACTGHAFHISGTNWLIYPWEIW